MTRTRRTLAALTGLAMTLGVPAALVLGTSAPAQACYFSPTAGERPLCGVTVSYVLTATPTTVITGDPVTLTLLRTDSGGRHDVTASSTFSISSGTCTANVCTPDAGGAVTVTARDSAAPGMTTSTTITAVAADHLVLDPGYEGVLAGQTMAYHVFRATPEGTRLDDVTAKATVTIDGTPCPGAVCTGTTAGTRAITATYAGLTGTASLLVLASPAASLVVTPAPHDVWNNVTPLRFTVEAFDAEGNDLGDVTAQSLLGVSPDGSCTANSCIPWTAGTHTVAAGYGAARGSVVLDAAPPVLPRISVVNTSVVEGTRRPSSALVTFRLDMPTPAPLTLAWHTVNGTAKAGKDYLRATGIITIPAGESAGQIEIHIVSDRKHEKNERFSVVLGNGFGVIVVKARGIVTIVDDD